MQRSESLMAQLGRKGCAHDAKALTRRRIQLHMNTFIGTLTGQSLCGGKMTLISNSHATRWHRLTLTATSPMRWLLKQMSLRNEKEKKPRNEVRLMECPLIKEFNDSLSVPRLDRRRAAELTLDFGLAPSKKEEPCKLSDGLKRGRKAKGKGNLVAKFRPYKAWCHRRCGRRLLAPCAPDTCFFFKYLVDILQS